jgi:hypothetical protein
MGIIVSNINVSMNGYNIFIVTGNFVDYDTNFIAKLRAFDPTKLVFLFRTIAK